MIPPPFFSKPDVLSLKNVNKIVPHLEQGGILIVVVIGLVTLLHKTSLPYRLVPAIHVAKVLEP
jgi:hypothetical protein